MRLDGIFGASKTPRDNDTPIADMRSSDTSPALGASRMHFHLPKPLHGWREFVGEVAIIVLGVLIALGAEQAVQSIEWSHKVDAAAADMNNELSAGDGPQAYGRLAMHDCVAKKLDSL